MRLALVHDWLLSEGGAQRVLASLSSHWPEAPIFTLIANPETTDRLLPGATIITSALQRAWRWGASHTALAPLMPSAIESFDLSDYDVVISSSVIFSKGIVTRPTTHHLSYCYSPTRQLWDQAHAYHRTLPWWRIGAHGLRLWDHAAAQRPDTIIAPSRTVQQRISRWYSRPSHIVHPPSTIDTSGYATSDQGFYLCVGRDVPMKNLGVVAQAFKKLNLPLIIAGSSGNSTQTIQYRAHVSDQERNQLYASCRALVVASDEDWGLTSIEAQSFGKPIIALRKGGATETITEYEHGIFFDDPIVEAITEAVLRFERGRHALDPAQIQQHAQAYGRQSFIQGITNLLPTC